jgi:hypothetical protein
MRDEILYLPPLRSRNPGEEATEEATDEAKGILRLDWWRCGEVVTELK